MLRRPAHTWFLRPENAVACYCRRGRVCTCPLPVTPQPQQHTITSSPNNTNWRSFSHLSTYIRNSTTRRLSTRSSALNYNPITSMSSSPKLSSMMSGATEKPGSMRTFDSLKKSQDTPADDPLVGIVKEIIHKLQNNPASITTEDARRLSENTVVSDLQTAKIISAVEAIASSSAAIHQVDPTLGQAPHTSLPTIINDLKAAVDQNPNDVTTEVLKNAQNVVSSKSTALSLNRMNVLTCNQRCRKPSATPMRLTPN